jgi:hypothetical protein
MRYAGLVLDNLSGSLSGHQLSDPLARVKHTGFDRVLRCPRRLSASRRQKILGRGRMVNPK